MTMLSGFFDRLVERIDKIDPESLQTHMRRLARERALLETIFQSLQEGIMVLDREGRLSYANHAAERLLGFSAEKAGRQTMARVLKDTAWDRLIDVDGGDAWSHILSREIEVHYPRHRFLSFYALPLPDPEGGEQELLIILRDITGEREQEATLLEGERLNAVKLLAAGVAHEIGNPLNALAIHLQLLARELEALPPGQRAPLAELVTVARNEVGRLDAVITQFLHAIRPATPQLAATDVTALLRETLDLMRTEIENRRIVVTVANTAAVPSVPADGQQIKQAFFNLIKNALEAMPGGGVLAITFTPGDVYLAIDFLDNGTGIAAEDFGRIFEPYHTTKEHGSGLGLMIVQRIVQEHGGQIEVSSKPGAGTRMRIMLPLAQRRMRMLKPPEETADKARPPATEPSRSVALRRHRRMLPGGGADTRQQQQQKRKPRGDGREQPSPPAERTAAPRDDNIVSA
jgi:two-component system, sporulation sensor kinase E